MDLGWTSRVVQYSCNLQRDTGLPARRDSTRKRGVFFFFFFFLGICIYNAQHVCNYKDAREVTIHLGLLEWVYGRLCMRDDVECGFGVVMAFTAAGI